MGVADTQRHLRLVSMFGEMQRHGLEAHGCTNECTRDDAHHAERHKAEGDGVPVKETRDDDVYREVHQHYDEAHEHELPHLYERGRPGCFHQKEGGR